MIKIRKLKPEDPMHDRDFPRRWVMTREADDGGLCDHLMGYFYSQQEAIGYVDCRPRIVVM